MVRPQADNASWCKHRCPTCLLSHVMFILAFRVLMAPSYMQFLFKFNKNCPPDSLAAPVLPSYSNLIQNWNRLLYWQSGCSTAPSLFNSYLKLIQIAFLTAWLFQYPLLFQILSKIYTNGSTDNQAALVVLPSSVLIQNWYKLLSWQLGCSSAPFSFKSYSKLIQIVLLTDRLI